MSTPTSSTCRSTRTGRLARALAVPAVAVAGLVAFAPAASAAATGPTLVEGNPACADLAPAGVTWKEAKLDFDPAPGAYTVGTLHVTIAKNAGGLDWTSDADVAAVIMKGGPVANVYAYPGAADLAGTGLVTPLNPNGGDDDKRYGISHVTFCVGPAPAVEETPDPETPAPETPKTPPAEVVPAAPQVEAAAAPVEAAAVPEAQVLGVTLERPAVAVAAAELPRTGAPTGLLALIAVAFLVAGGLLLALAGRPARN